MQQTGVLPELHAEAEAMALNGRLLSPAINDDTMSRHGKRWAVIDSERRIDFERRARTASQESAHELEVAKAHVCTPIGDFGS